MSYYAKAMFVGLCLILNCEYLLNLKILFTLISAIDHSSTL